MACAAFRHCGGKIKFVPSAIGKETGTVQFAHDSSCVGSKIAEVAAFRTQTVPMTSIDDYVKEQGIAVMKEFPAGGGYNFETVMETGI